jgi:UDP-N-acetylglucosamine--N-acetylmuramyl-(pentapeptide) pyrophosphoryl-undecaprenol N-acetylglucosamine transferase
MRGLRPRSPTTTTAARISERQTEANISSHVGAGEAAIVLVVGSTAGHVYPALGVADAFRRAGFARLLFVASHEGPAADAVPAAGERLRFVRAAPIKRAGTIGAVRAVLTVGRSVLESRRLLVQEDAGLVVGFGSYVSGGVLLAARGLGIPTVIHEANVRPGLANRLLRRVASRIYLASEEAAPCFPPSRTRLVGMPLRRSLQTGGARRAPARGERVGVLVTGGSRGEAFLSREVPRLLAAAGAGFRFDVTHQTGAVPVDDVLRAYRSQPGLDATVTAVPFVDDMAAAYGRAHVAIARGGAGTLAELAASGLPAVIVPLLDAADDHQTANARRYEAADAGLCAPEATWSRDAVAAWLRTILHNPIRWHHVSHSARRQANAGAAALMVDDCLTLMR